VPRARERPLETRRSHRSRERLPRLERLDACPARSDLGSDAAAVEGAPPLGPGEDAAPLLAQGGRRKEPMRAGLLERGEGVDPQCGNEAGPGDGERAAARSRGVAESAE